MGFPGLSFVSEGYKYLEGHPKQIQTNWPPASCACRKTCPSRRGSARLTAVQKLLQENPCSVASTTFRGFKSISFSAVYLWSHCPVVGGDQKNIDQHAAIAICKCNNIRYARQVPGLKPDDKRILVSPACQAYVCYDRHSRKQTSVNIGFAFPRKNMSNCATFYTVCRSRFVYWAWMLASTLFENVLPCLSCQEMLVAQRILYTIYSLCAHRIACVCV